MTADAATARQDTAQEAGQSEEEEQANLLLAPTEIRGHVWLSQANQQSRGHVGLSEADRESRGPR